MIAADSITVIDKVKVIPASGIIPQIGNKYFTAKCVCNNSTNCGRISRSFQELKDLRGSFVQFPMSNGSERFHLQNKMKIKRAERFSFCLKVPNPLDTKNENDGNATFVIDRRYRGKNAKNNITSIDQKGTRRRRGFVALHHFHPKVIDPRYGIAKVHCNGTRFKLPDLVTIGKLLSTGLMEYFTPDDWYDQNNFLIVPNYSLSQSEKDVSHLFKTSLQSSLPPLKRSWEDNVPISNQFTKRLKSCNDMENVSARDSFKIISDNQRDRCILLENILSRLHSVRTYNSNLIQSQHQGNRTLSPKLVTDLAIGDDIVVSSLYEVEFIYSLERQWANAYKTFLKEYNHDWPM